MSSIIGIVIGIIQARFVPPDDFGLFKAFGIATTYLGLMHLGLFDALQRELPFLLASGEREVAERKASAGLGWIRITLYLTFSCFGGLAVWQAFNKNWLAVAGWLTQIPVIMGTLYGGLLATFYRTDQEFKRLSYANASGSVAGLVLLPLVTVMPYMGLCIKTAGAAAANTAFLYRYRPLKVTAHYDKKELTKMLRIGTPLFIGGYVGSSLWLAAESTLALGLYGRKALGLLAVAFLLREAFAVLASSLNQVYMPKLAVEFGHTNSYQTCLRLSSRPCVASFIINSCLALIAFLLLRPAVSLLTPMYVDAMPALILALLSAPVKALELPLYIFKAAGNVKASIFVVVSGFVVFILVTLILWKSGMGFQSVILSSLVGKLVSIVVGFILMKLDRAE